MRICYHTGDTTPGAFSAYMASQGNQLVRDFPVQDPYKAIEHYCTNDAWQYSGIVLSSAFLQLTTPRPVLFRPNAKHCEALEHVAPNFTIHQYTQPYPVCIVEFPSDYASNRLIPLSADDQPRFAIIVKPKEPQVLAYGVYGSGDNVTFRHWRGNEPTLGVDTDVEAVACAALNFLMLVDDGEVTEAAIRPKNVKRKRRRVQNRSPSTPVFTLQDQSIRLFTTSRPDPDYVPPDDPCGAPKRPHWRKGHWRFYDGGKRVRIDPVFVNKHKLLTAH